jgi:hypothetical protein
MSLEGRGPGGESARGFGNALAGLGSVRPGTPDECAALRSDSVPIPKTPPPPTPAPCRCGQFCTS